VIIDSSALMAIVNGEPAGEELLTVAAGASCRMSVGTWLEISIVTDCRSPAHGARLDRVIEILEIELVPVTTRHAATARQAYRHYGRGSGSPARLNFGDCFAYALAIEAGEPLLYVGDDFSHTDVVPAVSGS
jgi:ribonuclease VapC